MTDTVFAQIVRGEIPTDLMYQDELVTAFRDIQPQAPTHILVVPNKPVPTLADVTDADEAAMGRMSSRVQSERRFVRGREAPQGAVESVLRTVGREPVEEHALALALHFPDILARVGEAAADRFTRPENRAILSALQETGTIEGASAQLDGPMAEHLGQLSTRVLPPADLKQRAAEWTECLRRLEGRYLRELKEQESVALAEDTSGDAEYREAVSRQALETNERLKDLFTGEAVKP